MPRSDLKVAMLYPWPGLPGVDRGVARRVMPLITFLSEQFSSVTVLLPGIQPALARENVRYVYHHPTALEERLTKLAFYLFDGLTHHFWRGRASIRERRQWWHYLQPRFQRSLHRAITDVASEADVILLEYPFWSATLERAFPGPRKPVILTLHDVLSEMIKEPSLKKIVENKEAEACRRSQGIVCDSLPDSEKVRSLGFATEYVPHGFEMDLETTLVDPRPDDPDLAKVTAQKESGSMVCLFVGSSLQPNREAVDAIREVAGKLEGEKGIFFVIAGACCGKMELGPNIHSLGVVTEDDLHRIYDVCDIVLAPIFSGTGSSTKVLEAQARGKVLISTSFGARSHGMVSGRDAIICDDMTEYPGILRRLRDHPGERRSLSENGRKFVQAFDFRVVYQTYVRMIQKLGGRQ